MPDTVVIVPENDSRPLADLVLEYAVVSSMKAHYESMDREVFICDSMPESREQAFTEVLDAIRGMIGPESFIGPGPLEGAEVVATANCGLNADEDFVDGMISILDGMGGEAKDTADALRGALTEWRYASGQILCEIGQPASGLNSDRKDGSDGDGGEGGLEAEEGDEGEENTIGDGFQPHLPSVTANDDRVLPCNAPASAPEGDGTVF